MEDCWSIVEQVLPSADRILLYGPSGTGKSYAGKRLGIAPSKEQIAAEAKLIWAERGCPDGQDREFWIAAERRLCEKINFNERVFSFSLTEDTPAAELRGHFGLKSGEYVWMDGPCVSSWRKGARLVLNELEKASGDAQTFLLGILDDPGIASITLPTGETVRPDSGFRCVATMNGDPDVDLNPALRDRFPIAINIDRIAPDALLALPEDIRNVVYNCSVVKDAQRRISVRSWNEFARLREEHNPTLAAKAVFGSRYSEVLAALNISKS